MGRVISGMDQYAYLPQASHTQIALHAEMTLPIRLYVYGISAHMHVEHGCEEHNAHIRKRLSRASISRVRDERAGTTTIDVDIEYDDEPFICRYHCRVECSECQQRVSLQR